MDAKMKILIVEDEPGLVTALRDRLKKEGYAVTVAKEGAAGLGLAIGERFDLIVLDLMLPGQSGLTICQKLREQGSVVPILMLTARRQTMDKVVGLRTGADDYLTKPFKMAELLARIDALLRRATRSTASGGSHYESGSVRIDMKRTEVTREGHVVPLSAKEFQLLSYLAAHRGETLSREVLLREVWGYDATPSTRTVDVHVAWLRQKLEKDPKDPQLIRTVVGLGYRFAD
jgi:two-component system alkaline phosphatase synthesis response regulator PhoP